MCDKCLALECLAVGAHFAAGKKSGWETTSACYFEDNNTIYVTSQVPNQTFFSIPMLPEGTEPQALQALAEWDPSRPVTGPMKALKDSVVRSGHAPDGQLAMKKARTSISRAWAVNCFNAGCRAPDEKRYTELAQALFGSDPHIKIVLDADIFAPGASAHQGFHGESRLIRYIFIKLLRKAIKGNLLNEPAIPANAMNDEFRRRAGGKLHMGSNRPACYDCATFMTEIGVHFESASATPSSSGIPWIHPFYLESGSDTITPAARAQTQRA
jgi:hypothetical protein